MITKFYKFSIKYSRRSLARNFRRSCLTIFTLAFCLSISIVASRYAISVMALWKEGASDTGTAHFQYVAQGYSSKSEGLDLDYTIEEGNEFEKYLLTDPEVEAISKRLNFEGLIKTQDHSFYFIAIAINPEDERKVSPRLFMDGLDIGSWLNPEDPETSVIGEGLARLMNLSLNDEATVVTQTVQGSINAVDIKINGYVHIPIPSFSERVLYMNIKNASKLVRTQNRYSQLAIRLKPKVDQKKWFKKVFPIVQKAGGELQGWWDVDPLIAKVDNIWVQIATLLCALLFFSAIITVLNSIFMIINERTVEIGTLKAIGASNKNIRVLISTEASIIGILGGVIGILVGNICVFIMGKLGVPFSSPFGGYDQIARPQVDISSSLLALLCVILGCALISLIPANKTNKLQPVEAFRNNT